MSVHLEMQIEELEEELVAIKAINQKIQLEKNALKEQFSLQGVSQQRELLDFMEVLEKMPRVNVPFDMKMLAIHTYLKSNCG